MSASASDDVTASIRPTKRFKSATGPACSLLLDEGEDYNKDLNEFSFPTPLQAATDATCVAPFQADAHASRPDAIKEEEEEHQTPQVKSEPHLQPAQSKQAIYENIENLASSRPSSSTTASPIVKDEKGSDPDKSQSIKAEAEISKKEESKYDIQTVKQEDKEDAAVIAGRQRWKRRVWLITKALLAWQRTHELEAFNAESQAVCVGAKSPAATEGATGTQGVTFDADQQQAISAAMAGESFFMTGSAGTGKSFVLKHIIQRLRARGLKVVVTASTGCAAVAIQGTTIHSACGVGIGMDSFKQLRSKALSPRLSKKLNHPDVLIIDEVSMLDSILFDKIETMYATARIHMSDYMRERKTSTSAPFGGCQVIACGDFFQLPPVAASDPKLQHSREKFYAFESGAWNKALGTVFMLRRVHRQADENFVGLLDELRHGVVSRFTMRVLSACRVAGADTEIDEDDRYVHYTKLYAFRNQVAAENYSRLEKLPGHVVAYSAKRQIDHPMLGMMSVGTVEGLLKSVTAVERLEIKMGARVVCVKNIDQASGIVNGSAGTVIGFVKRSKQLAERVIPAGKGKDDMARYSREPMTVDGLMAEDVLDINADALQREVKRWRRGLNGELEMDCEFGKLVPVVRFDNGMVKAIAVEEWTVVGMAGQTVAVLKQIPLMLGWALTIHKAQGMTLNRVETDVGRAFDYGQVYVALSRARNMQGLRLTTFAANKVMTHEKVENFYKQIN